MSKGLSTVCALFPTRQAQFPQPVRVGPGDPRVPGAINPVLKPWGAFRWYRPGNLCCCNPAPTLPPQGISGGRRKKAKEYSIKNRKFSIHTSYIA